MDDAPLGERRPPGVYARLAGEPSGAGELGALDMAAIERVRDEARPDPRDADELHDALLSAGWLTTDDAAVIPRELFDALVAARRAATCPIGWVPAERLPEFRAVHPGALCDPPIEPPASRAARVWTREAAIVELFRGRVAITGPTTADALARDLGIASADADPALLALEGEGLVLRGNFSAPNQWCERRLLARIHRYTLNRLRAEIEPVSQADFMRFLFAWQHVAPPSRLTGIDGVRAVLE